MEQRPSQNSANKARNNGRAPRKNPIIVHWNSTLRQWLDAILLSRRSSSARGAPRGPNRMTLPRTRRGRRSRHSFAVGRAVPGRAGADRAAAGGAGRCADARRRGPAAAERARRACAGSGGQREGGGVTAGDGLGRRRDDHRPHSHDVRKRGGRKLVVTPDGARVGAAAAGGQRDGEGAGAGVSVAEMLDDGHLRDVGGPCPGEGRERDLRQPSPAADAACAGHR